MSLPGGTPKTWVILLNGPLRLSVTSQPTTAAAESGLPPYFLPRVGRSRQLSW